MGPDAYAVQRGGLGRRTRDEQTGPWGGDWVVHGVEKTVGFSGGLVKLIRHCAKMG